MSKLKPYSWPKKTCKTFAVMKLMPELLGEYVESIEVYSGNDVNYLEVKIV